MFASPSKEGCAANNPQPKKTVIAMPRSITAVAMSFRPMFRSSRNLPERSTAQSDQRRFTLADPRVGPQSEGEVTSELAHPLYRCVMEQLPVTADTFGVAIASFWPPAATRFTRNFLEATLAARGFGGIRVTEGLYPMRGADVWNHICLNLWTVAKRWLATSGLSTNQFFGMLEHAIRTVRSAGEFDELASIPASHPY